MQGKLAIVCIISLMVCSLSSINSKSTSTNASKENHHKHEQRIKCLGALRLVKKKKKITNNFAVQQ